MIDFLLEVTGIKWLHDKWIVSQAMKRYEAEERLFQENLRNLWVPPAPPVRAPEFCTHCGAGIGKFRREGEGTCPECDPRILEDNNEG